MVSVLTPFQGKYKKAYEDNMHVYRQQMEEFYKRNPDAKELLTRYCIYMTCVVYWHCEAPLEACFVCCVFILRTSVSVFFVVYRSRRKNKTTSTGVAAATTSK